MQAFEALISGHPVATLLILAAGVIWMSIYFVTRRTDDDPAVERVDQVWPGFRR